MATNPSLVMNRRTAPSRMLGFRDGTLTGVHTPEQPIVIRDLSPRGLGARVLGKSPELGERVVVTIDTLGEVKAMVKWVSRDLFGLHFSRSLSRAQLDALRRLN